MLIMRLSSPFGGEKHGNRPRSRCYSAASAFSRADRKLPTFRPCPFRRPSMAGGRRPRAGTPLRHKHRENAARCVWRECPAQPAETQARRHVLNGLSRLGREVTDARDARSGLPGRGQLRADSPPNEQESRIKLFVTTLRADGGTLPVAISSIRPANYAKPRQDPVERPQPECCLGV